MSRDQPSCPAHAGRHSRVDASRPERGASSPRPSASMPSCLDSSARLQCSHSLHRCVDREASSLAVLPSMLEPRGINPRISIMTLRPPGIEPQISTTLQHPRGCGSRHPTTWARLRGCGSENCWSLQCCPPPDPGSCLSPHDIDQGGLRLNRYCGAHRRSAAHDRWIHLADGDARQCDAVGPVGRGHARARAT
jgi:hypothetical protein